MREHVLHECGRGPVRGMIDYSEGGQQVTDDTGSMTEPLAKPIVLLLRGKRTQTEFKNAPLRVGIDLEAACPGRNQRHERLGLMMATETGSMLGIRLRSTWRELLLFWQVTNWGGKNQLVGCGIVGSLITVGTGAGA